MLDPNKAWSLFMMDPVDFLIALGAVIAFFGGGAWWLRGHWSKERIAALEEHLRLVREQYESVNSQLAAAPARATSQENEIGELRSLLPPSVRIEQLARSNTEIQNALTSLATSRRKIDGLLDVGSFLGCPDRCDLIFNQRPLFPPRPNRVVGHCGCESRAPLQLGLLAP